MEKIEEVFVVLENKPGAIGELCGFLSQKKINIEAIGVFQDVAKLLVSDARRAIQELTKAGYEVETREVLKIDLPNEPGELAFLASKLGTAGINIEYCYGVMTKGQPTGSVILDVSDIDRALALFQ
jgi:hypothetical protein